MQQQHPNPTIHPLRSWPQPQPTIHSSSPPNHPTLPYMRIITEINDAPMLLKRGKNTPTVHLSVLRKYLEIRRQEFKHLYLMKDKDGKEVNYFPDAWKKIIDVTDLKEEEKQNQEKSQEENQEKSQEENQEENQEEIQEKKDQEKIQEENDESEKKKEQSHTQVRACSNCSNCVNCSNCPNCHPLPTVAKKPVKRRPVNTTDLKTLFGYPDPYDSSDPECVKQFTINRMNARVLQKIYQKYEVDIIFGSSKMEDKLTTSMFVHEYRTRLMNPLLCGGLECVRPMEPQIRYTKQKVVEEGEEQEEEKKEKNQKKQKKEKKEKKEKITKKNTTTGGKTKPIKKNN